MKALDLMIEGFHYEIQNKLFNTLIARSEELHLLTVASWLKLDTIGQSHRMERKMKSHFICRILLLTCFLVIVPLLALGVPESQDTLKSISSTKNMALLEPGTLLLLTLGGGGMVYLNKRKSKS